jgi:hypothetical protein
MLAGGWEGALGGLFLTLLPQVIPFLPPTMSQASNVPDQLSSLGSFRWCLVVGISALFSFLLHRLVCLLAGGGGDPWFQTLCPLVLCLLTHSALSLSRARTHTQSTHLLDSSTSSQNEHDFLPDVSLTDKPLLHLWELPPGTHGMLDLTELSRVNICCSHPNDTSSLFHTQYIDDNPL